MSLVAKFNAQIDLNSQRFSNHGVLGGMGGLFGGFGGGEDSGGHSSSSSEDVSTSNQRSDAGSSGSGGGFSGGNSESPPTHGKFGEELDPDRRYKLLPALQRMRSNCKRLIYSE
jgi:hypothetical protein